MSTKQTFVIDVDETICSSPQVPGDYTTCIPFTNMIAKINDLYEEGHTIILFTARGMRSCERNIDLIHERVKPVLVEYLRTHNVSYTELIFGKPWGPNVHYVDNNNMSMQEFLKYE